MVGQRSGLHCVSNPTESALTFGFMREPYRLREEIRNRAYVHARDSDLPQKSARLRLDSRDGASYPFVQRPGFQVRRAFAPACTTRSIARTPQNRWGGRGPEPGRISNLGDAELSFEATKFTSQILRCTSMAYIYTPDFNGNSSYTNTAHTFLGPENDSAPEFCKV